MDMHWSFRSVLAPCSPHLNAVVHLPPSSFFSTALALPDFPHRSWFLNLWQFLLSCSHCWLFLSTTIKYLLSSTGRVRFCLHDLLASFALYICLLLTCFPVYNLQGLEMTGLAWRQQRDLLIMSILLHLIYSTVKKESLWFKRFLSIVLILRVLVYNRSLCRKLSITVARRATIIFAFWQQKNPNDNLLYSCNTAHES